jgi:hypothetical protein
MKSENGEGTKMWQQYEMVTNVLVAEREARFDQAEQIRSAREETESGFAKDPFRSAVLLVALLIVVMAGRMILV